MNEPDDKLQQELARQALLYRIAQRGLAYRLPRMIRDRQILRRPKRP